VKGLLLAKTAVTRLLEGFVIVAVAALVLDVLWGVCSRFVLRDPSGWTVEVATMLLIWVSLLGAAVAFSRNEHLGVDYLVKKLDPDAGHLLAIVSQLVVIYFAAAVMVYGGYVLVHETLQAGQVSPALGVKIGYVYLAVPVSGVFIILFCLERIIETWSRKAS
jgi:TRAP-type C4-dicarboxylate transport system permease small subunit